MNTFDNPNLTEFVRDIGHWAEKTFGETWRGTGAFNHLLEEITELSEDLTNQEEIADCVIILLDLGHMNAKWKSKEDIVSVLVKKLSLNKQRDWRPADEHGVIRHL